MRYGSHIRSTHAEYINLQRRLHPDLWPAFLYKDFIIYEHNTWRGLLKSKIVLDVSSCADNFAQYSQLWQTAKLVFFGPCSLTPGAHVRGRCNATLNNMQEMTLASIVYAATLVCRCSLIPIVIFTFAQAFFALSSDAEFQPVPGPSGFGYKAFYDGMVQHLEEQPEERQQALLSWWNAYVTLRCYHRSR